MLRGIVCCIGSGWSTFRCPANYLGVRSSIRALVETLARVRRSSMTNPIPFPLIDRLSASEASSQLDEGRNRHQLRSTSHAPRPKLEALRKLWEDAESVVGEESKMLGEAS